MVFRIRKATKNDMEIIDELYVLNSAEEVKKQFPKRTKKSILEEFNQHEKSRKKSFFEELNKSNVIFVIAECEKEIIGFGQGIIEKSYGGNMGLMDKIYLNKKSRGKGFGIKIAEYLMQEMKKQKIDFFEWRCYVSNKGSVKLAEKLNLKPFSMRFRKNVRMTFFV